MTVTNLHVIYAPHILIQAKVLITSLQANYSIFSNVPPQAKPGIGLGLARCSKIAGLHQGSISASVVVGEGAIFTIMLQAADFT